MNAFTKACAVCGVSCAIAAHVPHHRYTIGEASMEPQAAAHQLHPELPEPGDFVREPQVAAVTSASQLPPGRFTSWQFPEPPRVIQPATINPNWLLLYGTPGVNAPTVVSSNT
jgi:hypothetical protein